MPAFIAMLWGALYTLTSSLVGRIFLALGLSVITYTGINASLDFLKLQAVTMFQGLPAGALGIIGLLKVGECISLVFSAMVTRLISQGLNNDTVKSWVLK